MTFEATELDGVYTVEPQRFTDERGWFARIWSPDEFVKRGLNPNLAQVSVSFNAKAGTLRGMHYQAAPHAEAKLVRVTAGAIWDAALDLRPQSKTYLKWFGVELTAGNGRMLYIPEGCAHGFQTLTDETVVNYHISAAYEPAAGRGVRFDDPTFGIDWPGPVNVIATRDATYPLWSVS